MTAFARILAFAAALVLPWAVPSWAEERILDFESRVEIAADGGLTVTETITVQSEGREIKRGIYRDFPTIYEGRGGRDHIVAFDVVEVLRGGRRENWFTRKRDNGVRLYAGEENVYLRPGRYTYTLTYRTDRQIGFFEDYDELYWNVTGNDWVFPIDNARVTIVLPPDATIVQTAAYTGRRGATGQAWTYRTDARGNPMFQSTRRLAPGEGLTVAVAWPKGIVTPPTAAEEAWWTLRAYLGYVAAMAVWLAVLVYYLLVWRKVGRDPEAGTVVPRWRPPTGISPAASRFISEMGFDSKAIGAAVISLAVKGKLIVEDDGDDEYTLRRHDGGFGVKLSPGEKAMERALFAWGDSASVRNGNHARLKPAVDALKAALSADFEGAHFRRNLGWFALGVALSIVSLVPLGPAIAASPGTAGVAPVIMAVAGVILLNALFFKLLKAPTLQGRAIMDEIEGFKMYLATAEQERLDLLHPPERTPELFEKYLPYAMALDVETEWGEQFQDVFAAAASGGEDGYHPGWYHGRRGYRSWSSPGRFAGSLGSSLGGAISSAATPPGSSSGSGGGGSSGGGGGGGGGGGW